MPLSRADFHPKSILAVVEKSAAYFIRAAAEHVNTGERATKPPAAQKAADKNAENINKRGWSDTFGHGY